MSKQPKALRLADWCDAHSSGDYRPSAEAAAELRRLHEVNAELLFQMRYIQEQTNVGHIHDVVSAAIAKAEGDQA